MRRTTATEFSKTFLVFYKWRNLTDVQVIVHSKDSMPCEFCVLRAHSLVILSLFGFTSQQYTSNTKFSDFIFFLPGRTGIKEFKKGDSQTKDRKTPKTRRKRLSFRNGLGTFRGVYEATTIAHHTPPEPLRSQRCVGGTYLWGAHIGIVAKYRVCPSY
jgi:hypothetical protein